MQASARPNHFSAGSQPKMISVAKDYARVEIVFQRFKTHALDGSRCAYWHEDGRLDDSTSGGQDSRTSLAGSSYHIESNGWFIGPIGHIGPISFFSQLTLPRLLVLLNNSQGSCKEIKLFAQTVLQVTLIRKVEAGFTA